MEKHVADQLVNVESNWEKYPDFGDWDSIFRMKRWKEGEIIYPVLTVINETKIQ